MKKFLSVIFLMTVLGFPLSASAETIQMYPFYGPGWTLAGNPLNTPMSTVTMFGNYGSFGGQHNLYQEGVTNKVLSVWKWTGNGWAFYTPLLDGASLQVYAAGNGYTVLEYIYPGEGYWVSTIDYVSLDLISGEPDASLAITLTFGNVPAGWYMVAPSSYMTASELAAMGNQGPPTPGGGVVRQNYEGTRVVSMWAWDQWEGNWYFYSPVLEMAYGPAYAEGFVKKMGYLPMDGLLYPGTGLWMNFSAEPVSYDERG